MHLGIGSTWSHTYKFTYTLALGLSDGIRTHSHTPWHRVHLTAFLHIHIHPGIGSTLPHTYTFTFTLASGLPYHIRTHSSTPWHRVFLTAYVHIHIHLCIGSFWSRAYSFTYTMASALPYRVRTHSLTVQIIRVKNGKTIKNTPARMPARTVARNLVFIDVCQTNIQIIKC